jgi:hypothetical protein
MIDSSCCELTRVDKRPISDDFTECRGFMVTRNEALRLPYVLDYHRRLGVRRFFVIDNASDDGSLEYIVSQPDCHVYTTRGSYRDSNYGVTWINHLVKRHGTGHWCLNIDADECFVYPNCESVPLPKFCDYLSKVRAQGLFCFMLDMYGTGPIKEAHYRQGDDFLNTCACHDSFYVFRRRLGIARFPPIEVIGGPRLRCFYPEVGTGVLSQNWSKLKRKIQSALGSGPSVAVPPLLVKVPLIFGDAGQWINAHNLTPLRLASVSGVLLHFKYFSDFHERVETALREGQHWHDGSEYAQYRRILSLNGDVNLCGSSTVYYKDSVELVRWGLLRTSPAYEAWCRQLANAAPGTLAGDGPGRFSPKRPSNGFA